MLKVGMIGAGIIGESHLSAIANHAETQLSAVADLVLTRAQHAAQPYNARAYSNYEEMLSKERLDCVIINLPHGLHEVCVLAAAQCGAHILLEKPMSVSYNSCLKINEACKKANVLLQIGHIQRYFPQNRAALALIKSQKLGKLAMINDLRTTNYFVPDRPRWFLDKKMAGGGISMNYAAHSIDKICYLTQSDVIFKAGSCTCFAQDADVDGSAQLLLQTQSGVSASISLCGYATAPVNETMLFFQNGAMRLRTGTDLSVTYGGEYETVNTEMYPDAFDAQWNDFVAGIKGGKIFAPDGEYGASILNIIEQLYHDGGNA